MTPSERQFWAAFDPAWLATYDANAERIRLIQAAFDELEYANRLKTESDEHMFNVDCK